MNRISKVIIIVSILCAVLLISATLALCWLLRGPNSKTTRDVSLYGQWELPEKYSTLAVFPEKIPETAQKVTYYYKYQSGWNRPMCQIFLKCTFSEEEFAAEAERVRNIQIQTESGILGVKYDAESFVYPAYTAIEGYDFCYEYVLINEPEYQIIYAYAMNTMYADVGFDRKYLPDDYMANFTDISVDGLDRYTIYGGYGR